MSPRRGYEEIIPRTEEVMDLVTRTLNYMMSCPLIRELCEELGNSVSHSYFTVILVGYQEEKLWLVVTTRENYRCF
jgi:hypothetical protein